ncbi:MAG TPA: hypothetical protein VFP68_22435 [Burkholderiaceae bacterium]|nr:hypothetical protein [Burkholderiaceae bacterium]
MMSARRLLAWTAAVVALGLTFFSYLQRDFVFSLANQVWACFQ